MILISYDQPQPRHKHPIGGGGSSNEKVASQKATKLYVDNSFESPTSLTIDGPPSISTTAGAGEADYTIVNAPKWASGFKDVQVTCTDARVTISSVTKRSFHVAVSGFSSSADINLVLTATGNDGTALSTTKTVNVISIFTGIGIQHNDGTVYSRTDWQAHVPAFTADDARGIAVGDGTHSFCLYKMCTNSICWSTNASVKVDVGGLPYTTDVQTDAAADFGGKANTDAILAAVSAGTIADAPAAQWARNNTFGSEAYLPTAGELVMICNSTNRTEIAACSDVIGGNLASMFSGNYSPWSSTQCSETSAWCWRSFGSLLYYDYKGGTLHGYALGCVAL